jgi:hypothetical protein
MVSLKYQNPETNMKKFLLMLGVAAMMTFTQSAIAQTTETVDTVLTKDVQVFTNKEKTLTDSLATAKDVVVNEDIKTVIDRAQDVIKTFPEKGAPFEDYVSWAIGALGVIGIIVAYIRGKAAGEKKRSVS